MYDLLSSSEDYSNSIMEIKNAISARRKSIIKNKETIQVNRSKCSLTVVNKIKLSLAITKS